MFICNTNNNNIWENKKCRKFLQIIDVKNALGLIYILFIQKTIL